MVSPRRLGARGGAIRSGRPLSISADLSVDLRGCCAPGPGAHPVMSKTRPYSPTPLSRRGRSDPAGRTARAVLAAGSAAQRDARIPHERLKYRALFIEDVTPHCIVETVSSTEKSARDDLRQIRPGSDAFDVAVEFAGEQARGLQHGRHAGMRLNGIRDHLMGSFWIVRIERQGIGVSSNDGFCHMRDSCIKPAGAMHRGKAPLCSKSTTLSHCEPCALCTVRA